MDQDLEQRVWERVNGQPVPVTSLREMEMRCLESGAVFHQLARNTSGEQREQLMSLARREQASAMTLRGMRILDGEEPEPQPPTPPLRLSPRRALAQSLRRSQQACRDYTASSAAGEYAGVFQLMAEEEEKIIADILSLIGR